VDSKRLEKVGDLVRKEIASMLVLGDIKDPRIGFVTITKVRMTSDLKKAEVYFSTIGTSGDVEKCGEGLSSASGYIRRALAKRLDLRHIPSLNFTFDDSLEYSDRIERIIKKIKEEEGA